MRTWVVIVAVAAGALTGCSSHPIQAAPLCHAGSATLDPEQALNAATIAAVAKRVGMPDHAVTIALATALQESKLRNLDYGDRDSLGIFQQRPSQGWGTPAHITNPRLSAETFFEHLRRVRNWQTLPITVAAQRVQHSAAPDAYAQWEEPSRDLARALTGEDPAGFACQFASKPVPDGGVKLAERAELELGTGGLSRTSTPVKAWATASWLVANAHSYGVSRVSLAGQTWQAKRGTWVADPKASTLTFS